MSATLEDKIHKALATLRDRPHYTALYVYETPWGYTISKQTPSGRVAYYRVLIGNTGAVVSCIPAHG